MSTRNEMMEEMIGYLQQIACALEEIRDELRKEQCTIKNECWNFQSRKKK